MKIRFHDIRLDILSDWEGITKRELNSKYGNLSNDDFSGGYECIWQDMYKDHVHVFCSLAEWCNNITDILLDTRYDHLFLTDETHLEGTIEYEECRMLFRYYTRLFLVVSEIITDFEDIINDLLEHTKKEDKKKSRRILSRSYVKTKPIGLLSHNEETEEIYNAINLMMDYINTICKHKFGREDQIKLHRVNNHLPYVFQFNRDFDELHDYLNKFKCQNFYYILFPSIYLVFDLISSCYMTLHELICNKENSTRFTNFCIKNS